MLEGCGKKNVDQAATPADPRPAGINPTMVEEGVGGRMLFASSNSLQWFAEPVHCLLFYVRVEINGDIVYIFDSAGRPLLPQAPGSRAWALLNSVGKIKGGCPHAVHGTCKLPG